MTATAQHQTDESPKPVRYERCVPRARSLATYNPALIGNDSAYRRDVEWLNSKEPIPRSFAKARLQSLMKFQGTSVDATAAFEDIENCLRLAGAGQKPIFGKDFQEALIKTALDEMRSGRIENFGFERLLQTVFLGLGAEEVRIVPRMKDKGADLLATFVVAGAIRQLVAIQAKHWGNESPVGADVVDQLINGIEAEGADLGIVVTTGLISDAAIEATKSYLEKTGVYVELIDGEQLARLIIENGISI